MGVSRSRMRKLMDGRGAGSPGVAAKMGALVDTIGAGNWCEEQGSLMRALAYGILDPDGERYRLALLHRDACPACRAYVLSLRGLAAVLPPAPGLLHLALGAAAAGGAAGAGVSGAAGAGSAVGPSGAGATATGANAAGAGAGAGLAGGALSASGAAGVGAACGSWWLAAGPLGAKLAVGCLLALGVGAGCVALERGSGGVRSPSYRHRGASEADAARQRASSAGAGALRPVGPAALNGSARASVPGSQTTIAAARKASREFGPEQAGAGVAPSASGGSSGPTASAASAGQTAASGGQRSTAAPASPAPTGAGAAAAPAAQREFSPG